MSLGGIFVIYQLIILFMFKFQHRGGIRCYFPCDIASFYANLPLKEAWSISLGVMSISLLDNRDYLIIVIFVGMPSLFPFRKHRTTSTLDSHFPNGRYTINPLTL